MGNVKKSTTVAAAGSLGGKARAKSLTAKQRSDIARHAITTRWERVRQNGTGPASVSPEPTLSGLRSAPANLGAVKRKNVATKKGKA